MVLGLFGKLPGRRDFIAADVPRTFLTPWEDWLMAALPTSQEALGDDWPMRFAAAPTWRFWLAPALCGSAALGAFVPSHDGVGRQYPLAIVALGDLAPPQHDPRDAWFAVVEAFLRTAATPGTTYPQVLSAREAVVDPPPSRPSQGAGTPAFESATTMRRTYWWTRADDASQNAFIECDGFPTPSEFAAMLTGRWRQPGSA